MLTAEEIKKIFENCGALIQNGHFIYTSGRHGKEYVNKDAIYPHTSLISKLCEQFAEKFVGNNIEAVLAPALGGIILSQWTAFHLSRLSGKEVFSTYAEKTADGQFVLKRGYDQWIENRRTLVVEDVLTTGGSVKKIIELARAHKANVIAVAALVNRGAITADQVGHSTLFSLVNLAFDSWESANCPLCQSQVPVNRHVGKG